jgi:primosomal protein N'
VDGSEYDEAGQLALMPEVARARARKARESAAKKAAGPKPVDPAGENPVARVLVDVPLAHLDRPFDYLVPQKMASDAVPGARVKVRFAGQDVDGFVLERVEESSHEGRLAPLRRAVSPEPVLSPAIAHLSASVAARYADPVRRALVIDPHHRGRPHRAPAPASLRRRSAWRGTASRSCGTWRVARSVRRRGEAGDALARRRRDVRVRSRRLSACPTTVTWPGRRG